MRSNSPGDHKALFKCTGAPSADDKKVNLVRVAFLLLPAVAGLLPVVGALRRDVALLRSGVGPLLRADVRNLAFSWSILYMLILNMKKVIRFCYLSKSGKRLKEGGYASYRVCLLLSKLRRDSNGRMA